MVFIPLVILVLWMGIQPADFSHVFEASVKAMAESLQTPSSFPSIAAQ